ncbi:MAG: hypothetical protein IIZ13_09580 [Renibacterium sp.]|nr:hypothetical protein [Renibacterium sp.]
MEPIEPSPGAGGAVDRMPGTVRAAVLLMALGAMQSLLWLWLLFPLYLPDGFLDPGDWFWSLVLFAILPAVLPAALWTAMAVATAIGWRRVRGVSSLLAGANFLALLAGFLVISLMIGMSYAPEGSNPFQQAGSVQALSIPLADLLISATAMILVWTRSARPYLLRC